ncbi:hypothetical protein CANINC_004100 [Pichia inconspicua]|uniref:C2H2-type domain-containing protein n=1 Tax=Pichia inconspicua TaxID=52247 RepID=A0A4T0WX16_9ASCO|nr:hypothetical protein CANINC_004100 [[Candida] inconspicua]
MSLKRPREKDNVIDDLKLNTETTEKQQKTINKQKNKSKGPKETNIECNLPPLCSQDPKQFDSFEQYELHYISEHTNICTECKKNFPIYRLLELHIAENHDPFIKIKLQRGDKVFGCFVENCDKLFRDHKKRRLHLIDKHDYPRDYIFSIVDRGIRKSDTSLIKKNSQAYGVWKSANST